MNDSMVHVTEQFVNVCILVGSDLSCFQVPFLSAGCFRMVACEAPCWVVKTKLTALYYLFVSDAAAAMRTGSCLKGDAGIFPFLFKAFRRLYCFFLWELVVPKL